MDSLSSGTSGKINSPNSAAITWLSRQICVATTFPTSPPALDQYKMKVLVEDVRALADHFSHHRKFVLVAHDWGGAVAWAFAIQHPEMLEKLVIVNAPHPGVFGRLLASDAAQQQASQYMLMFRSPQAEGNLSANNYGVLVAAVLGAGLKSGVFTEEDKQAYIKAWSQPGALTGGLNYYRANEIGPPATGQGASPARGNFAVDPNALPGQGAHARHLGRERTQPSLDRIWTASTSSFPS